MSWLRYLRQIYSLDTLDTRFTASSNTPLKSDARVDPAKPGSAVDSNRRPLADGAKPSKWNTPEFYFYYFMFITIVPLMFKTVYDVSKRKHQCHSNYLIYFPNIEQLHILVTQSMSICSLMDGFQDGKPYVLVHSICIKDN